MTISSQTLRRAIGLLILLVSLGILLWSLWPLGANTQVVPIAPTYMQLPTPQGHLLNVLVI